MNPAKYYNLELFLALNQEYESKRVAKPVTGPNRLVSRTEKRAQRLDRLFKVRGKRVLDLGCGHGLLAAELARSYGCEVVAVDIESYASWEQNSHPRLTYKQADLASGHDLRDASFDVIYSWSVMEHVRHPFRMLRTCRDLLAPAGQFLLVAHLYRSATGSHRSREVFFPWPHLLFTDDVFEQFYVGRGRPPTRPAWLNKLTYADYFRYFELLGFVVEKEFVRKRDLDKTFYNRFEDELSKYAAFDLQTNAVEVVLSVDRSAALDDEPVNRLVRRSAINRSAGESGASGRARAGALVRAAGRVHTTARRLATDLRAIGGSVSRRAIAPFRDGGARERVWPYWSSEGKLSTLWQCQRAGATKQIGEDARSVRITSSSTGTFYLCSRGGAFDKPPAAPDEWSAAPNSEYSLTVPVTEQIGDAAVECWVIEYDDEHRLRHSRQMLGPGATEVRWRTGKSTRCLRLALRFTGPVDVVLGPPRLTRVEG